MKGHATNMKKYNNFEATENNKTLQRQKILYINDLERIIGRSRVTIRKWWMAGKFPKPIKLNGTDLAWHAAVIEQWIEESLNPISIQEGIEG